MLISNIKGDNLAVLEQGCERYATMIYEVATGKIATGFKSITYSYNDDGRVNQGYFMAKFISKKNKRTGVSKEFQVLLIITAVEDTKSWNIMDGSALSVSEKESGEKKFKSWNIYFTPNSGIALEAETVRADWYCGTSFADRQRSQKISTERRNYIQL